jgi:hypothetical protein
VQELVAEVREAGWDGELLVLPAHLTWAEVAALLESIALVQVGTILECNSSAERAEEGCRSAARGAASIQAGRPKGGAGTLTFIAASGSPPCRIFSQRLPGDGGKDGDE